MAFSKALEFEDYESFEVQLAATARSIAHPMRVRILQHLIRHERANASELMELGPLHPSTTSHHIRKLRERMLILAEVRGPFVEYRINRVALPGLKWMFEVTFDGIDRTDIDGEHRSLGHADSHENLD